jgi:hypothetical protein
VQGRKPSPLFSEKAADFQNLRERQIRPRSSFMKVATAGVPAGDVELRMSKAGNTYANLSLVVNQGEDESGKPITQWVRVAIFGDVAELIARTAHKGDRLYGEGSLTQGREKFRERHLIKHLSWR